MTTDSTCNIIQAMRSQEEAYRPCKCLEEIAPVQLSFLLNLSGNNNVDEKCRFLMIKWWYQIVDYCKMNRDTVAIAASYLDRFLMTEEGKESRRDTRAFQLTASACLYTAIKISETEALAPHVLASLSGKQGLTGTDIEEMERKIIHALEWRMNPPTYYQFVHLFLDFLPESIDKKEQKAILEVAKYQTELATQEYSLVSTNASTIAFAAFANALQTLDADLKNDILSNLSKVAGVDMNSSEYITAQEGLWLALDHAVGNGNDLLLPLSTTAVSSKTSPSSTGTGNVSPRGVVPKQC